MSPTATAFDPFADHPTFKYASGSTVRPAYPLSPKPAIPDNIVKPNYARESVRDSIMFWWEVRIHEATLTETQLSPVSDTLSTSYPLY